MPVAKILVVDDEIHFASHIEVMFSLHGHEVRMAGNPWDAMAIGNKLRPDILVTDWMLKSEIDGGQVATMMKEVCPELKVIVITGCTNLAQKSGELPDAVDVVIEKPFRMEALLDEITRFLSPTQR